MATFHFRRFPRFPGFPCCLLFWAKVLPAGDDVETDDDDAGADADADVDVSISIISAVDECNACMRAARVERGAFLLPLLPIPVLCSQPAHHPPRFLLPGRLPTCQATKQLCKFVGHRFALFHQKLPKNKRQQQRQRRCTAAKLAFIVEPSAITHTAPLLPPTPPQEKYSKGSTQPIPTYISHTNLPSHCGTING